MGSSGGGKTTLRDVIAGRKAGGKIAGRIMQNIFKAVSVDCEQMDVHSEAAMDASIPDTKKYASVNECIE
ncbi:hypothetical protein V7S43_016668 [Phytophthora oleae]|uniref:ABC transporter domain-containing protein n=1 Tax=Phytophthora oleae TaxID=2107226 RepID=A0ABD3EZ90_9STRA